MSEQITKLREELQAGLELAKSIISEGLGAISIKLYDFEKEIDSGNIKGREIYTEFLKIVSKPPINQLMLSKNKLASGSAELSSIDNLLTVVLTAQTVTLATMKNFQFDFPEALPETWRNEAKTFISGYSEFSDNTGVHNLLDLLKEIEKTHQGGDKNVSNKETD